MEALSSELVTRLEQVLGRPIADARTVDRGYTPALRLRLALADGTSVFAKVATVGLTGEWLRREKRVYDALGGRPFLPRLVGWEDDGVAPILVLEDLSDAHWPPPWEPGQVGLVRDALEQVWASSVPGLDAAADYGKLFDCWETIAANPGPFLSLGLATRSWLDAALPTFLAIDGPATARGDALLHCDLRSDNLCLRDGQAVLIDWNHACYGNPRFELAAWLPSLAAEGGPLPESILPDGGEVAAVIAGYFAANAGLPIIPEAPRVREIQKVQLHTALPWAARALGLPPPDGPNAPYP